MVARRIRLNARIGKRKEVKGMSKVEGEG